MVADGKMMEVARVKSTEGRAASADWLVSGKCSGPSRKRFRVSSFSTTTSQRWRFINVSTPCPQFDSKEMTMTPTEWLILTITTFAL